MSAAPKTLIPGDIAAAAHRHQVEAAALKAVLQVEAGGGGFLPDGRPKVLFERHWLWRRLQARNISPQRLATARPDLCGERWERRYYVGGAGEYARVKAVIDWASIQDGDRWESYKKAALESCSWGLPQVMGFHYDRLGFPDVYALKHWMERGEVEQLDVFMRFLETGDLIPVLRRKDWISFARIYNGPGQVPLYAARLLAAYLKAKK